MSTLNTRGEGDIIGQKMIFYPIIAFVIAMVVLGFGFTIASYKNKAAELPRELDSEYIALRFLLSPDCFAADNNGVVQPGVIDAGKFTQQRLDSCYFPGKGFGKRTPAFRIVLREANQPEGEEIGRGVPEEAKPKEAEMPENAGRREGAGRQWELLSSNYAFGRKERKISYAVLVQSEPVQSGQPPGEPGGQPAKQGLAPGNLELWVNDG